MGAFCPSSKVTTLYKAVYIEKKTLVLDHLAY